MGSAVEPLRKRVHGKNAGCMGVRVPGRIHGEHPAARLSPGRHRFAGGMRDHDGCMPANHQIKAVCQIKSERIKMPVMRNFRKVMERTRESYGLSTSGPGADAVHRVLRSVGAERLAGQSQGGCDAGVHRQVRVGTESGRGAGGGSIGCLGLHPLVGTPEADSRAGNSTPAKTLVTGFSNCLTTA